jgi:putative NADH-flavin reductase
MATVLVIGAGRGVGLETVKQALEAEHAVRALARSAGKIPIEHPALTKIAADALDRQALENALDSVDAVIQTLGAKPGPGVMLKSVTLFSSATRALIPAMKRAKIKRLIALTGFGAGDSRDRGGLLNKVAFHLFLKRAYDDKDAQEKLIRASRSRLDDRAAGDPVRRLANRPLSCADRA